MQSIQYELYLDIDLLSQLSIKWEQSLNPNKNVNIHSFPLPNATGKE